MAIPQILQQLGKSRGLTIPPQIKQMISFVKMSKNPQAAMQQLIQNNPQLQQVMQMIQMSGKDPMALMETLAKQKGIDPQEIMDLLE